jgi:hypothetical protein
MTRAWLLLLPVLLMSASRTSDTEPTQVSPAALARSSSVEASNEMLRRRYECLNRQGYAFKRDAGGSWSGQIGPPSEPFAESKRRLDAAVAVCDARTPLPAPS